MADWSLLTTPNFAQAMQTGWAAGSALGRQQRLDNAMQAIDLSRPETLLPVLRADPATGAALIGSSLKISSDQRDRDAAAATAAYIKSVYGTGNTAPPAVGPAAVVGMPPPGATMPAMGSPPPALAAAGTPAPPPHPTLATPIIGGQAGDIVVNAPPGVTPPPAPTPDPATLRNAAIDADPTGFLAMQKQIDEHLASANKEQLARAADTTNAVAIVGQQALSLPYPQRRAFIQAQSAYLMQHGFDANAIASFDPTDDNIHMQVGQALGVKTQAEQLLAAQRLAEDRRHHLIDEGQGAQRIGLEGANVGIAAGHLAIDRSREAREAGKSAPGAGGPPPATVRTLPNGGKAYRNPANGKWYDNPEFR